MMMTNSKRNPHEEAARSRKVLAILSVVPTGETSEQNRIIAEFLAALSVPERAIFAKKAKVNAPSKETWDLVLSAVRARTPIAEVEAVPVATDEEETTPIEHETGEELMRKYRAQRQQDGAL